MKEVKENQLVYQAKPKGLGLVEMLILTGDEHGQDLRRIKNGTISLSHDTFH